MINPVDILNVHIKYSFDKYKSFSERLRSAEKVSRRLKIDLHIDYHTCSIHYNTVLKDGFVCGKCVRDATLSGSQTKKFNAATTGRN